jgi:hypothetical protein
MKLNFLLMLMEFLALFARSSLFLRLLLLFLGFWKFNFVLKSLILLRLDGDSGDVYTLRFFWIFLFLIFKLFKVFCLKI